MFKPGTIERLRAHCQCTQERHFGMATEIVHEETCALGWYAKCIRLHSLTGDVLDMMSEHEKTAHAKDWAELNRLHMELSA